jgi:TonB family protein
MSWIRTCCAALLLFGWAGGLPAGAAPAACKIRTLSPEFAAQLPDLQYRVRKGKDMLRIKEDLNRLSLTANCYDAQMIRTLQVEAEAFSRTPSLALPALDLLYKHADPASQRYHLALRALARNYAILGRTEALETLIRNHPDVAPDLRAHWRTDLAMAHAHKGNMTEAVTAIEQVLKAPQPPADTYHIAIAIHEVAGNFAQAAQWTYYADTELGGLDWPQALPGMSETRFDILYLRRFDPVLSDVSPNFPPDPTYPRRALRDGIEGTCNVRFDVSQTGIPINLSATCTSAIFKQEAERAVSVIRFTPLQYRGETYIRRNVLYPLEFSLGAQG